MRSRRSLTVFLTVGTVLLATAATADASSDRPVAIWEMNEHSGARTMTDSSGRGLHGRIGGEVRIDTRVNGATGYRFDRLEPDSPPTHPGHLVTVRDSDALDPGTRDFAVTVRLRTTHKFGNIIQKGQATVSGGNFKLQIPSGIVECLFRGSSRSLAVSSPRRLNDGRWHTVRCARTGDGVTLVVDGATVARSAGWTGRIANSWPVSIGGKTDCDQIDVGCDYYAGDLDYVEIDAR
ncbi:laminin G domain-containing protein [Actinoplanes sp. NPDC048967]|uniref:laminin G domain-containing protein n=1 Tax=Actinoplanes sp. NPDC048967 TaxID=3155269 RepID=UPI003402CD76